ncbi:MAG: proteinase inhibitor [Myxococcota bacterium]
MLLPCLLTSACAKAPVDLSDVPEEALAYCVYTNRFSQLEECREYLGEAWTTESAEDDCASQEGTAFGEGGCPYDEALGRCVLNAGDDDVYRIVFPGSDEEQCASLQRGCELFGGGAFVADTPCGGLPPSSGGGSGGLPVFQPAELMCQEPLAGEPAGSAEGGQVCTWSAISACTEEGRKFADYASCETVLTQRPYWPAPAGGEAAPADDPRHDDVEYQEELAWVKGQIESCACTCCHSSEVAPDGPSNWYVEAGPFFVDSFYESGLALGAGFIDSASFGAYAPEDNNGFARTLSGFPSTDPPRMKAFFERALADRGYTAEDFADETPFGGPLYTQSIYEPSACTRGEGVTAEGDLVWTGGGVKNSFSIILC